MTARFNDFGHYNSYYFSSFLLSNVKPLLFKVMRLFRIIVLLSISVLLKSCTIYQKMPVSIEEAQDKGKVKVVTHNGKKTHNFKSFELKDGVFYGYSMGKIEINPLQITGIYVKDNARSKKATKNLLIWTPIVITGGLLTVIYGEYALILLILLVAR